MIDNFYKRYMNEKKKTNSVSPHLTSLYKPKKIIRHNSKNLSTPNYSERNRNSNNSITELSSKKKPIQIKNSDLKTIDNNLNKAKLVKSHILNMKIIDNIDDGIAEYKKKNNFLKDKISNLKKKIILLEDDNEFLKKQSENYKKYEQESSNYILSLEKEIFNLENEIKIIKMNNQNNSIIENEMNLIKNENNDLKEFRKKIFQLSKNYSDINNKALELFKKLAILFNELKVDDEKMIKNYGFVNIHTSLEGLINIIIRDNKLKQDEFNLLIKEKDNEIEKIKLQLINMEKSNELLKSQIKKKENIIKDLKFQIKNDFELQIKDNISNLIKNKSLIKSGSGNNVIKKANKYHSNRNEKKEKDNSKK